MTDQMRDLLDSSFDTDGFAKSLAARVLTPLTATRPPTLEVESCPHPLDENLRFELRREDYPYRIGRKSEICEFPIRDPLISKSHAAITLLGHRVYLTDDRSKNGVIVNGHLLPRQTPKRLRHGDTIVIGLTRLRFRDSCAVPLESVSDLISTWFRERGLPGQPG